MCVYIYIEREGRVERGFWVYCGIGGVESDEGLCISRGNGR